MPDRARAMDFVAMVVSGDHVGAIGSPRWKSRQLRKAIGS